VRVNKPLLGTLAFTLLAGSAVAGCGGGSGSPNEDSKNITLTVWWWGEQEAPGAQKFMDDAVKKYHELHPNITIKTVLQSTDQLIPAFQSAAQAHQGPDIEYFWGGIYTLQNAWNGSIVPINDLIPESERKHYLNNEERTWNGKQYGIGWYMSDNVIAYNKDLFKKAGLDPNNPPKTWDELMAACEKLKAKGITPFAGGLKDGWFAGWIWQMMNKQSLDSVNDFIRLSVGQGKVSDPKFSDWWHKLEYTIHKGYWNNDVASLDYQQGQEVWVQGNAAMLIANDTFFPGWIRKYGADKFGIMPMPSFSNGKMGGTVTTTAQGWGITSWSKHQKEAADFLMFLHTPEELKAWYEDTGVIPADDRFDPSQISSPQMKQMYEWDKSNASLNLENFCPDVLEPRAIFPGVQGLFAGTTTADKAIAQEESVLDTWRQQQSQIVQNFEKWIQ
jgi:raffinose/stachyose/melibiose transport system substrate-binding protein